MFCRLYDIWPNVWVKAKAGGVATITLLLGTETVSVTETVTVELPAIVIEP